jgi:hypothetical protein
LTTGISKAVPVKVSIEKTVTGEKPIERTEFKS